MKSQLYRLYKDSEIDEANEYLARNLSLKNTEMSYNILEEFVRMTYGVNSPQMANYDIIDNLFFTKFNNRLLNYIKNAGIDCNIIEWSPANIYTYVLMRNLKKGINNINRNWNPNEKWDFSKKMIPEDIIHPLNSYTFLSIIFNNICNKPFIIDAIKYGLIDEKYYSELINNDFKIDKLEISILPSNDINSILNMIDIIFKYF